MVTLLVEVQLPIEAEFWVCDEVYVLETVTAQDIADMARRVWTCDPCNDEEAASDD